MYVLITVLCLFCSAGVHSQNFNVPDVQIEALNPKGFRVSIPDEDGIQLFAFHGKINEEMNGREAGTFSKDIVTSENGRWTFFERNTVLKIGDVIYYWIHVRFNGTGYEKDGEHFTVTELVDREGYDVPDILIEALKPNGLKVSIPDEDGIQLFAFHGTVNRKMNGREAGTFSVDIRKSENGRWTFRDKNVHLDINDTLYYWVHVRYNGVGYEKDGQPYTITELIEIDEYEVPDVLIEPLKPNGLRVSIPDEEGMELFAFHGKINEEMNGREAGTFSVDILNPEDGRWTFYDNNARLKMGDVIYYWIHVMCNGTGYEKDGQPFTVTELVYNVPDVLIEALKPKGLRVSIPDEKGIQLFAFHGKINEEMNGREAGTFSVDIRKSKNGRWTFFNHNVNLKIGDILYYWVHVRYNRIGYEKDGAPFTVAELVEYDGPLRTDSNTTKISKNEHTV